MRSVRKNVAENYVAGMFLDATSTTRTSGRSTPDPSRRASNDNSWKEGQVRLTWQASTRHKFALSYDQQYACYCPNAVTATRRSRPLPALVPTRALVCRATGRFRSPVACSSKRRVSAPRNRQARPEGGIESADDSGHRAGRRHSRPHLSGESHLFRQPEYVVLLSRGGLLRHGRARAQDRVQQRPRWAGPNLAYSLQPVSYRFNNGVPNQVTLNGRRMRRRRTWTMTSGCTRRIAGRSSG